MEEEAAPPWYRQFWPWFIMVPPGVSVVAGLLTFYLAGGEPAMVVADYGQIARVTAQRVERAQHAAKLGLDAQLNFDVDSQRNVRSVSVALDRTEIDYDRPDSVILQLIHPTKSELDLSIELMGLQGRYTGRLDRPTGRYYVLLSDPDETWHLTGELTAGATALTLHSGNSAE